jgi:hypothetical protein
MAQANRKSSTKLSDLISDPVVRAAFQRAERDFGQTFAIPGDRPQVLDGGAAERVRELEVV